MQTVYAIYDTKAEAIIGGLHLFRNDTAAIRFFSDLANADKTIINTHTEDFDLQALGDLTEDNILESYAKPKLVLSGAKWLAAQEGHRAPQLIKEA